MKIRLIGSALFICVSSAAFAADLPSRKVQPTAPAVPAFTWTGFYVGVNAGYGGNDVSNPVTFGRRTAMPAPAGDFNLTTSGGLIGAQLGYN